MKFNVIRTKHNGKEGKNFRLSREHGNDDYLFLHFKTPTIFTLKGETTYIQPGTCIILSPKTPHSFYPDNCELIHDWMHFMPDCEKDFSDLKIDINSFFVLNDSNFITSSVKKCEFELLYKDRFYEELISSEVFSMFIKIKSMYIK